MVQHLSPEERESLYKKITEKILFIGDSGDDVEEEEKIFKKAKQNIVVLLGDFTFTSNLNRKHAEEKTKKGNAVLYTKGLIGVADALKYLSKKDDDEIRKALTDAVSINTYLAKVKEVFIDIRKRIRPLKGKKVYFVAGNHDFNLKKLYKDYIKSGGKKINIQFLESDKPLKIEQFEIFAVLCKKDIGGKPDDMLDESEIELVENKLDNSLSPVKILVCHLPSIYSHRNLGSSAINMLIPKSDIFFHGHCFNYRNESYGIVNNFTGNFSRMLCNTHIYSEKLLTGLLEYSKKRNIVTKQSSVAEITPTLVYNVNLKKWNRKSSD